MDFFCKDNLLTRRALAVLGFQDDDFPEDKSIRYGYHCRMLKHHPDRNPDDPQAHEIAALLNEAYGRLLGKPQGTTLLENKGLVERLLDDPVGVLDEVPTYEEWLKEQFYDTLNKSIWAY